MGVSFYKTIRDIFENKSRTILAVLALAIGIAGAGFSLSAYAILSREMGKNYMRTNPASIVLETEKCDKTFIDQLKQNKLIEDVELRRTIEARYHSAEDTWTRALLYVVDDYSNVRIDKVTAEEGEWPARNGEIILERAGVKSVVEKIGENITIKLPEENETKLKYIGKSYAPGLAPAWMEGTLYGYINEETYKMLGGTSDIKELHIVVSENKNNREEISETALIIKKEIERSGRKVKSMEIPKPGKHPHAGQMDSLIFLIQMLGVLCLILSTILTVNLISAQLSKQKREIGIMKVFGGTPVKIAMIYINTVIIIGVAALLIGVPVGLLFGNIYAKFTAGILNFEILSNYVPHWVFVVQIVAGIGLPVAASLVPITQGSRMSVYEAINDQGIDTGEFGSSFVDRHLERVNIIGRPGMLSLRNTFRKRGRFLLTLVTLAAGGAIFIVAMNFKDSLVYTINQVFAAKKYDIQITLSKPYNTDEIGRVFSNVEGLDKVNIVGSASGEFLRKDGTEGEKFKIMALPIKEKLIIPQMMDGKWLEKKGVNSIVINHVVASEEREFQDVKTGDKVTIMINGTGREFVVSGIAREPASLGIGYIDIDYYNRNIGIGTVSNELLITGKDNSRESQIKLSRNIEKAAKENGIDIAASYRLSISKKIIDDHLVVIFKFLMVVAILIVIVGGMGLASAMGINVVERTREIGIMRSIGATSEVIISMVLLESAVIGIISWGVAVVVAPFISKYESEVFGKIFFGTGLDVRVSPTGSIMWLVFVICISMAAAAYPAWKASKMSVKEALKYE